MSKQNIAKSGSNVITIGNTVIKQKDGLYCLNDLHRASGAQAKNKPANFLRVEQTQALISAIDKCENQQAAANDEKGVQRAHHLDSQCSDVRTALKVINGGKDRGSYGCKELVYAYAMWIDAEFNLKVIRSFDEAIQKELEALRLDHENDYLTDSQAGHIYQIVMGICRDGDIAYQTVFGNLKRKFCVSSYKLIPSSKYKEACSYLGAQPKDDFVSDDEPKPLPDMKGTRWLGSIDRKGQMHMKALEGDETILPVSKWPDYIRTEVVDDSIILELLKVCTSQVNRIIYHQQSKITALKPA